MLDIKEITIRLKEIYFSDDKIKKQIRFLYYELGGSVEAWEEYEKMVEDI